MKKFSLMVGSIGVCTYPAIALAQLTKEGGASGGKFGILLDNSIKFIFADLVPFILAIGFLVFVWGMFQYFIAGGANDEKKVAGKSLMIYATLGFVLIIVFWGVVNLFADSTGLEGETLKKVPKVIVPKGTPEGA